MSILFFVISGLLFVAAAGGTASHVDNYDIPIGLAFIASGIFAIAGVLA